ncbi:MAG: bifunctional UDP-N-acetylglucosamine diphosphorylase/glucosamine-1-phosphate N-acetyltransferase GlmU [Armatimonadaceae bacterium]
MTAHLLQALADAGVSRRLVVVGHQAEVVQSALDTHFGAGTLEFVLQAEQKGTGHAVQITEPALHDFGGTVLVLPGDAPLLEHDILRQLLDFHRENHAAATVLTALLPHDAGSYGRIVRSDAGSVLGIVEARDATPEQLAIREINTGVYAFERNALFAALERLQPNNAQGELYLTDVLAVLRESGQSVAAVVSPDTDVVLGVNTRVELAEIAAKMRQRILRRLMLSGVTIVDPATTYIDASVGIGQDSIIHPGTVISGKTRIGEECQIGPSAHLADALIGDRSAVRLCVIENAEVGEDCRVGPYTHLRPGTKLASKVRLGNFVEIKNAELAEGVAVGHLSYLGDAKVGAGTNIGAGTITCNYDGFQKHRTEIGARSFIGSHSTLVAPVSVGDDAFTAAGSVITDHVPSDALAIARERQTTKEGWMSRYRARLDEKRAAERGKEQKNS